jgi:hypothetical protein
MALDVNAKYLMKLCSRDADTDGWTPVSDQVWPLLDMVPDELMEKHAEASGGKVRLTDKGVTVLFYT